MANEIPPEWTDAAVNASRALQVARRIVKKNALDDCLPAAILPAVVVAVAVSHAAARVADAVGSLGFQPVDFGGIEHQLSDIAGAIQNHD